MNFTGGTSTQPKVVRMICIRDYVAEVRKKDWKKCCPFNLWGGSEESNRKAKMVYLSLFLENDDHLVNSQDNIEAPNFTIASEEGDHDVQAIVSKTNTTIMSQSSIEASDADGPVQENLSEDHVRLLKNDKQERNLAGLEPKKFRMLSEIYNELDDSGNTRMTPPAVAPTVVGAKRIRTVPALVPLIGEENICESPPSSDDDMMAATILFRMSNGGVQTKTLSKTAGEKEAISKAKGKGPCEDDGQVSPAAGSALLQDVMHRMSRCVMNRNPSEFKTEEAKKFRQGC